MVGRYLLTGPGDELTKVLGEIGDFFDALGELPAAFTVSFVAGVLTSLVDTDGQEKLTDVDLGGSAIWSQSDESGEREAGGGE